MSSTALYKAFIETGASDKSASAAADDVIQISQLPQLATRTDIANLKTDIANVQTNIANTETRLLKWMVGCGFLFAGAIIAGTGILMQVMLSSLIAG
jgi:hypothetical protein